MGVPFVFIRSIFHAEVYFYQPSFSGSTSELTPIPT